MASLFHRKLTGLLLLLVAAAPAPAREELLRYVPSDVGFCLVVQDLRGHAASLATSDFYRHFLNSPLGKTLSKDAEVKKLLDFEQVLEKHLGLTWARLRDDILGDAVVLAYRPGPPGKPEQEQGLFLVRARDARLLADFVERLNQVQKQSGELKELQAYEHNGRKYHRRRESKGDNYYYLEGSVLVLSPQEGMLRQALDQERTWPAGDEPVVARQLRLLGAERQLASLWINPQAFTPEIEWKAAQAGAAEAAVLKNFLAYWKALEGAALCAAVRKDFELTLAVRARTEDIPAAGRRLLAEAAKPSDLWARFPDNALLAVAGRLDAPAVLAFLDGFLTAETRQAFHRSLDDLVAVLGKKGVKEVLPGIGPDWGLCITAPPAGARAWFPQTVLAVRIHPGDGDARMDQAILSAVNSYAMLAVVAYNRQHPDQLVLKSGRQGKVDVKYLANERAFPPGVQPAFALHQGYLVLASSPEAVGRFVGAEPTSAPAGETPLLRMSLKDARRFLADYREPLIAASAESNKISREEATRGLEGLLQGLQLFDRVEISHRSAGGQTTLTLRLQPAHGLKKSE